jgi:alkylation response protein AidB-like acyl-CoA dehydrogenase
VVLALEEFCARAEAWLEANRDRRPPARELVWGEGSDDVSVFRNLTAEEERRHIESVRVWQQQKMDAGYGSIGWPAEYGGAGLSRAYEHAFRSLESGFDTPAGHEAVSITLELVGPTILTAGDDEQKRRYLPRLRRTDDMWCQLFSEPGAGSDLASLTTKAERHGDHWQLDGQKVWTSGAQYADFGYIICRTDPVAPRHAGLTAFLIPMDAPGVEVRPLRQMSGGSSFNEVFLTGVIVPDENRLGPVGGGWQVAVTTLGFERAASVSTGPAGEDLFARMVMAARQRGRNGDPVVRQALAAVYAHDRVRTMTRRRVARSAGGVPGPEGSIGKLAWTEGLRRKSDAISTILGPALVADTGEWGTYAWSEFVCGAPGYRIAGGSDEVQRNIIAERVLGLPKEPK